LLGVQLNFRPRDIDLRSSPRLELIHRLVVKRLRNSHLGLLRFDVGIVGDNLQIGVSDDQRDHIKNILIAELCRLFGRLC